MRALLPSFFSRPTLGLPSLPSLGALAPDAVAPFAAGAALPLPLGAVESEDLLRAMSPGYGRTCPAPRAPSGAPPSSGLGVRPAVPAPGPRSPAGRAGPRGRSCARG